MLSAYLYVHEHVVGSLKGNNMGIVHLGSEGRRVGLVVAVSMKCVESSNNHCTFDFSSRRLCQVQDVWPTQMKTERIRRHQDVVVSDNFQPHEFVLCCHDGVLVADINYEKGPDCLAEQTTN